MAVTWNNEELRNRTQMEEINGTTYDSSGVIVNQQTKSPILDEKSKKIYLNLSEDEIISDFTAILEKDFVKTNAEYISDNGLISVNNAFGMGDYVSVSGYAKVLEERIGGEFGILETYLSQIIDEQQEFDRKEGEWLINDPQSAMHNYIFKKIISAHANNIDENEKIQVTIDGTPDYITLEQLVNLCKAKVENQIVNRAEVLYKLASEQEYTNPISEIEIDASENSEQIIEHFSDDSVPVEEKRKLYDSIHRSANDFWLDKKLDRILKRNLVSIAILPIVNSLLSGKILTSANAEYREQLENSLRIVNGDVLDGIIPDYVITTVKAMDAATRLEDARLKEHDEKKVDHEVADILEENTKAKVTDEKYDIEQEFEEPWHEYHTATRATEEQFWKALDALKTLKSEVAKDNKAAFSTLSDLYRSGVAGVFMAELYGSENISDEERLIMSDELLQRANPGVDLEQQKIDYLHSKYERVMNIEATGIEYTPEELFEILLVNAEEGHVASMQEIARLYEEGKGVEYNNTAAEKWYSLAKAANGKPVYQKKKSAGTTNKKTTDTKQKR
jgi:hypothetical protein